MGNPVDSASSKSVQRGSLATDKAVPDSEPSIRECPDHEYYSSTTGQPKGKTFYTESGAPAEPADDYWSFGQSFKDIVDLPGSTSFPRYIAPTDDPHEAMVGAALRQKDTLRHTTDDSVEFYPLDRSFYASPFDNKAPAVPLANTTYTDVPYVVDQSEINLSSFRSLATLSPLLTNIAIGLQQFSEKETDAFAPSETYIVLDINDGVIRRARETDALQSREGRIYIPENDINAMLLIRAASGILAARKRNDITHREADRELRALQGEINNYETPRLRRRAEELQAKVEDRNSQIARHRRKIMRLESDIKHYLRTTGVYQHVSEEGLQEAKAAKLRLETKIAELSRKNDLDRSTLKGIVHALVFHESMISFSSGTNEDEIVRDAANTLSNYDFNNEALTYANQSTRLSQELGDPVGTLEGKFLEAKYNTVADSDDNVITYFNLLTEADDALAKVETDPMFLLQDSPEDYFEARRSFSFISPELTEQYVEGTKKELVRLRAEIVRSFMSDVVEEAGDDVDDRALIYANKKLDQYIDEAIHDPDISDTVAMNLIIARMDSDRVHTRAAQSETEMAIFDERAKLMNKVTKRFPKVEELYRHYRETVSEKDQNPMASEVFGSYVKLTKFTRFQQTGHAYDGLINFCNYVERNNIPSSAIDQTYTWLQEKAPHLFDENGLKPTSEHTYAPDADEVETIVSLSNLMPGGIWENLRNDAIGGWAGSQLGGTISASVAAASAVEGAATGASGGPPGAAIGFVVGTIGGAVYTRHSHSDEIEQMQKQAARVGIEIAQIDMEDARQEIGLAILCFGLAGIGAKPAGEAVIKWGRRTVKLSTKNGRKYLRREAMRELRKFKKVGLAAIRAGHALVVGVKHHPTLRHLSTAEKLASLLGIGQKTTRDNFRKLISNFLEDTRGALKTRVIRGADDAFDDDTASAFARLVIRESDDAVKEGKKFRRLLERAGDGKVNREAFVRRARKIFGDADDDINTIADAIFNGRVAAADRAGHLAGTLRGKMIDDPGDFVGNLFKALGKDADAAMLAGITSELGTLDAMAVLRLYRMVHDKGMRVVQLDQLIKEIVDDKRAASELLESLLTGSTKEDVAGIAAREKGRFSGMRIDDGYIDALVDGATQNKLYDHVIKMLREDEDFARRLATQMVDVGSDGERLLFELMDDNIRGFREMSDGIARGSQVDLSNERGRIEFFQQVLRDDGKAREFVDMLLGKGVGTADKNRIPDKARNIFFDTVLDSREKGRALHGRRRSVRHTMADAVRPTLREWNSIRLSGVGDSTLRGQRRIDRDTLIEALLLTGEPGDDFITAILHTLSPNHVAEFGEHIPEGIRHYRQSLRMRVVDRLSRSLSYKPKSGFFDPVLRPANRLVDGIVGPIDRAAAKRMEAMSLAVRTADPSMHLDPIIMRKGLLRYSYMAREGHFAGKKGAELFAKKPGPFMRGFDHAYGWVSDNVLTTEVKRAHRFCMPYAAYEWADAEAEEREMSVGGVICFLASANYMFEKATLGQTGAFDIAYIQRVFGMWYAIDAAGSDSPMDFGRFRGTMAEAMMASQAQNTFFYGLNIAHKLPGFWWAVNIPGLRRLPFSYTSAPFFGWYRGNHLSPDFQGWKGNGFTLFAGAGTAAGVAWALKDKSVLDAHPEIARTTFCRQGGNGPLVNKPGFKLQRVLKREGANAGHTSTPRTALERALGTATLLAWYEMSDIFAGKAEWWNNMTVTLESADTVSSIEEARELRKKAFGVQVSRYYVDPLSIGKIWNGVGFAPGVAWHEDQWKSWYKDEGDKMQMKDGEMRMGYWPEMARKRPEILRQNLLAIEETIEDPEADWHAGNIITQPGEGTGLYYNLLGIKYYATKYHLNPGTYSEYEPFADFVDRFPHKQFMANIPDVYSFDQLHEVHMRVEAGGAASKEELGWDVSQVMSLLDTGNIQERYRKEFEEEFKTEPKEKSAKVDEEESDQRVEQLEKDMPRCTNADPCVRVEYDEEEGRNKLVYFGNQGLPMKAEIEPHKEGSHWTYYDNAWIYGRPDNYVPDLSDEEMIMNLPPLDQENPTGLEIYLSPLNQSDTNFPDTMPESSKRNNSDME